jgi:hypothetical protein
VPPAPVAAIEEVFVSDGRGESMREQTYKAPCFAVWVKNGVYTLALQAVDVTDDMGDCRTITPMLCWAGNYLKLLIDPEGIGDNIFIDDRVQDRWNGLN